MPAELLGARLREILTPDRMRELMDRAVERWEGDEPGLVEIARVMLRSELGISRAPRLACGPGLDHVPDLVHASGDGDDQPHRAVRVGQHVELRALRCRSSSWERSVVASTAPGTAEATAPVTAPSLRTHGWVSGGAPGPLNYPDATPCGVRGRRLREEVADLRHEGRVARARRTRGALGTAAVVAVAYMGLAVAVMLVPHRTGGTYWILGLAALFAGLCTTAGLVAVDQPDDAAEFRGRLVAARRHRDHLLDSLPGSGPGVERDLIDDLDDARDVRRRIRRQVGGYVVVAVGAATTLGLGLVGAGPAWSWTPTEAWVLVAAFGTTAFGGAGLLSVALAGRHGPARANVRPRWRPGLRRELRRRHELSGRRGRS